MLKISKKEDKCLIAGTPEEIVNELGNGIYALLDCAAEHGEDVANDVFTDLMVTMAKAIAKLNRKYGFTIKPALAEEAFSKPKNPTPEEAKELLDSLKDLTIDELDNLFHKIFGEKKDDKKEED